MPKTTWSSEVVLISQSEIFVKYPEAFKALPNNYKNNCLEFWHQRKILYARPKENQRAALGNWVMRYNSLGLWVKVK